MLTKRSVKPTDNMRRSTKGKSSLYQNYTGCCFPGVYTANLNPQALPLNPPQEGNKKADVPPPPAHRGLSRRSEPQGPKNPKARKQKHNVGAFIIRKGFWGLLSIIIVLSYTPNPYSNYGGPYTLNTSSSPYRTL